MSRKRYKPEQIINLLREAEVGLSQDRRIGEICRSLGISEQSYYRHEPPDHIRSDNGAEFTAKAVRAWLRRIGVKTLYIEPGSPWENGYNESFNGCAAAREASSETSCSMEKSSLR